MKKLLTCIALVFAMLFTFTGCSADGITIADASEATTVSEEKTLSENWRDFEFQLEDNIYKLPIDSKRLKSLTDSNFVVENGELLRYSLSDDALLCIKLKNKPILMVGLKEEILQGEICEDSLVVSIGQTKEQAENGKMAVVFPGGVYAGMETTWDALERLYGKPDIVTDYYSEVEYKWTLGESSGANYLQIYLKENEYINEIKMDFSAPDMLEALMEIEE